MQERKIRVLLVLHELSLTGAPKVALEAFEELRSAVSLRIITFAGGPLAPRARKLGHVTLAPSGAPRIARPFCAAAAKLLSVWARVWRPDVVYINSVACLPALKGFTLPRAPVLLHVHELEAVIREHTGSQEQMAMRSAAGCIADSAAVAECLTSRFGVDHDRVSVVHEFVPSRVLASLDRKPPRTGGPFLVGAAGSTGWRKAPGVWLQMAAHLAGRMTPQSVRFRWVGVSNERDDFALRSIARRLGISDAVELVPVTDNPWRYFADMDVFAVTSWEEPFCIALAENMALGTPGVCFAGCEGTPEVIGDTGVIVPEFDPRAMAAAIEELLVDSGRLRALGDAARARVLQCFTSDVQVPRIMSAIQRLADGHREPGRGTPKGVVPSKA